MQRAGVIGLGDMGSGLALNLLKAGFPTIGCDLKPDRMAAFAAMGGQGAGTPAEVGEGADFAFVMVMTGDQAKAVILGPDGLAAHMAAGGVILLTATIKPAEAREIAEGLTGTGIGLIDSPVSGGYPGAQGGTLTMMAAAPADLLAQARPPMQAVSATIHHVGTEAGMGQTVKACLQALLGSMFSATFEAAVLAAKAGVPGEVFHNVVSTSSGGCGITSNALQKIIDRQFTGTGSHINTMHKDLTISMDLAESLGVPMFTAATAMQLFAAGRSRYPDGDNWICTRLLEEIAGAELHR
jgi:3-hydroxyisobutyrate dehydrogenase-like beta-hydroxyacid dehydrogenase